MVKLPKSRFLRRPLVSACHWFRALTREEFHFWVDVTTLIASLATVVTLVLLLLDRPQQANIAAWTLLHSYLQDQKPAQFDVGQRFALETLVNNGVDLTGIDAHEVALERAKLRHAKFQLSIFKGANLSDDDLSDSNFYGTDFSPAPTRPTSIESCICRKVSFGFANLSGAIIISGDFTDAVFESADVSDMTIIDGVGFSDNPAEKALFNPDAFLLACYKQGHLPTFPAGSQIKKPTKICSSSRSAGKHISVQ